MLQTIEGILDEEGNVRLAERVPVEGPTRVLVTVLPSNEPDRAVRSVERIAGAINHEWNTTEESEAWAYLEADRSHR